MGYEMEFHCHFLWSICIDSVNRYIFSWMLLNHDHKVGKCGKPNKSSPSHIGGAHEIGCVYPLVN